MRVFPKALTSARAASRLVPARPTASRSIYWLVHIFCLLNSIWAIMLPNLLSHSPSSFSLSLGICGLRSQIWKEERFISCLLALQPHILQFNPQACFWCKQQTFIFSRFWRPRGPSQGVSRVDFFPLRLLSLVCWWLKSTCVLTVFLLCVSVSWSCLISSAVILDEGPPSWPHGNFILSLKTVSKYNHVLRCWGLDLLYCHTCFVLFFKLKMF